MSKTETKSTVLVKHHLKQLRLPTMHAECEKIAARAAQENVDHLAFLLQLCELELIERERKAAERRLKAARFPAHKTLEEFGLQGAAEREQAAAVGAAEGGVSRAAGEHPLGRSFGNGEDALGDQPGDRRLRPGTARPLLPRGRAPVAQRLMWQCETA